MSKSPKKFCPANRKRPFREFSKMDSFGKDKMDNIYGQVHCQRSVQLIVLCVQIYYIINICAFRVNNNLKTKL